MKISISAIGRLRNSPEKELVDDYLSRFSKLSKPFGISLNPVIEIEDKKGGGPMSEAKLLMKSFQRNSKIIALDERGLVLSSISTIEFKESPKGFESLENLDK